MLEIETKQVELDIAGEICTVEVHTTNIPHNNSIDNLIFVTKTVDNHQNLA